MLEGVRTGCARALHGGGRQITLAMVGLAYAGIYLYAVGDLDLGTWEPVAWQVAADPWALMFQARGPWYFEAVARLRAGWASLLVAPLNIAIAFVLGALVAVNAGLAWHMVRTPRACATGAPTTGVLAAVPALLAGSACCGPALLLALGIPATATLIGVFGMLVPLAFVLLLGALVFNARRIVA